MQNNLLNKYLLSSYVASALFLSTAGVTTFFAKKNIQMAKTNPENQEIVNRCKTTYFVCLSVITASIIMSVFSGLTYPMIIRRKVKNMTKHYLQDIFVHYPETRNYRFILEDSKKLHEIAAIVCNGLTETEQEEILNLLDKELKDLTTTNQSAKLHKIENLIMDIVQKHVARDPKYMDKILYAIVNAQKPSIAETAQKVR